MAFTTAMATSFKEELLQGVHDLDTGGNTVRVALYVYAVTGGAATTAYTATNESSGTGYVAAGATVTLNGTGITGTTGYVDFGDAQWTSSTIADGGGCMIYNDTVAGDPCISVHDFGSALSTSAGTFDVIMPATGATAIIRLA